ncbi:hypothetical protein GPALN_010887 [Globodera pallida]|nr:hypothetical protein GPALN_010887 [Globodera pallida]
MLKFQRSSKSAADSPTLSSRSLPPDRRCSFVSSQLGQSRAVVVIRKISVPLAWPVEEYFSARKDWREFILQLVLRTADGKEFVSKPMEKINRTYTDVNFPDEFIFTDQGHNFIIELTVYCRRTDKSGTNASKVHTFSRSLGRSLGQSWKRYVQQQHEHQQQREIASSNGPNKSFLEMLRRAGEEEDKRRSLGLPPLMLDEEHMADHGQPSQMCAVGNAHFRLQNASLSGRVHNYAMDKLPATAVVERQELLPIYGSVCAQILLQPSSLVSPLAHGSLDIFLPDQGILHQRLRCSLQGGQLKCWDLEAGNSENASRSSNWSLISLSPGKVPILTLPINEATRVEKTAFPTAFRLIFNAQEQTNLTTNILCICATRSALLGWRSALQLQILDCSVWSDFALRLRNPHGAGLGPLVGAAGPPTFQRLVGMEITDNEEDDGTEDSLQICNITPIDDKMPISKNEERPRASSSASMLFRKELPMSSIKHGPNAFESKNGAVSHQKALSRTTLLDTSGQLTMTTGTFGESRASAPASPSLSIIRRKTMQTAADDDTGNRSPSILRRFSQRPRQNISWSLRELCPAEQQNGATDFFNNSLDLMPLSPEASMSPPTIEEEEPEDEIETIDKNKHKKMDENEHQPSNYVISLQIKPHETNNNGPIIDSSFKNALTGTMPTMEMNANEKNTLLTTSISSSTPAANNHLIHCIKVNASASSPNDDTSAPSKEMHKNNRPFHVNSGLSQSPARWTRAHIGRSETWHFARIGEACTRL